MQLKHHRFTTRRDKSIEKNNGKEAFGWNKNDDIRQQLNYETIRIKK